MNWIEKVNTKLQITTGDGKTYNPYWMNAVMTVEYNTSEFDFVDVEGTLVKRTKRRGYKYNLEIIFQGEDHLDQSAEFKISANDSRAWIISHPIYEQIVVQPSSLTYDNSGDNVTRITGTVMETIEEDNPSAVLDAQSKILSDKESMDQAFLDNWQFTFISTQLSINYLTKNTEQFYLEGKKVIDDDESFNLFVNFYNEANAAILDISNDPLNTVQKVQNFINSMANLQLNVSSRMQALTAFFDNLSTSLTTKSEKVVFENNAGMVISAMAVTAATPLSGNYQNRPQVLSIIDTLYSYYNLYLVTLDDLQSTNYSSPDSYVPDPQSMWKLNLLVNFTIASLFTIALGAKQERIIYLAESSNVINLTHRFLGLDLDDENLMKFVENNDIGLNEILNVPKGRKIVFYI